MVGRLIVEEAPAVDATPAGSPEASPAASPEASGQSAASGPVEVDMLDALQFDPPQITIPANTDVTIIANNLGVLPHTFTIPEVADTGEVAGGSSAEVVVNLPPGEYEFICAIPGHAEGGMVGTLIVE
jgi:plastocyanin